MYKTVLLPNRYKKLGWALLIPATVLGIISIINGFEWLKLEVRVPALINSDLLAPSCIGCIIKTNIVNTLLGFLFIVGALLVSFSKEKNEDEFIASLRQSSLLWAVLLNYILLALAFLFIYGLAFLQVMLYNMFTVLIIYIVRFNYVLVRSNKSAA